jgi:predicted hydrocarbon binding protein
MHGLIFAELRKYTNGTLGIGSWPKLLAAAGLADKVYMPLGAYPDEQLVALVSTAATMTDRTVDETLEDFGEFIAPDLLDRYRGLISKEWKTLDIIERTEQTIHSVVRTREEGADPPRLRCIRRSRNRVDITYSSPRRLCAFAKGIVRGIAAAMKEGVFITERSCMHKGAPACEIVVTLEQSGPGPAAA